MIQLPAGVVFVWRVVTGWNGGPGGIGNSEAGAGSDQVPHVPIFDPNNIEGYVRNPITGEWKHPWGNRGQTTISC